MRAKRARYVGQSWCPLCRLDLRVSIWVLGDDVACTPCWNKRGVETVAKTSDDVSEADCDFKKGAKK